MKKNTHHLIKIISATALLLALFSVDPAFAAEIRLDSHKANISLGEEFSVDMVIHSEENLNAVQGKVTFPADLLEVREIRDGDSVMSFWIEKPRVDIPGTIVFGGVSPGGFVGANNRVLSVVFKAKNNGIASIEVDGIKALRNDGLGTEATISTRDTSVSIRPGDSNVRKEVLVDRDIPEDFSPIVVSDQDVYGGDHFLAFVTQDKKSGIAFYEIKEYRFRTTSIFSRYHLAESPYLLRDQQLKSHIVVRAVDKAGNVRTVNVVPQNSLAWYEHMMYWAIMTILLGAVIALWYIKRAKDKK